MTLREKIGNVRNRYIIDNNYWECPNCRNEVRLHFYLRDDCGFNVNYTIEESIEDEDYEI